MWSKVLPDVDHGGPVGGGGDVDGEGGHGAAGQPVGHAGHQVTRVTLGKFLANISHLGSHTREQAPKNTTK